MRRRLAEALFGATSDIADELVQVGPDRVVDSRVLDIAPYDERARAALGTAAPPPPLVARPDDHTRVGLLYLLGYSFKALQRKGEARSYFQRVYATDPNFRDVAAWLAAIEQASR